MQINGEVKKEEVEQILGYEITDSQFAKALEYASRKQAYIFECEGRAVIMQRWYLINLTAEYVKNLAFSRFTMDLCGEIGNMEKERLSKERGTPISNCIVTFPVL